MLFVRSTDGKRIHSLPEPAGDMACAAQTKIFDTEPEHLPITDTKGVVRFLPPKSLSERVNELLQEINQMLANSPANDNILRDASFALDEAKESLEEFEQSQASKANLMGMNEDIAAIRKDQAGKEISIVRQNLMNRAGYAPYCGGMRCFTRSVFDGEQFKCRCGWRSQYEPQFIRDYKKVWNLQ